MRKIHRRMFVGGSMAATAAGAARGAGVLAAKTGLPKSDAMPTGKIAGLEVSRLLLGGNLLTHYTHSRDLKYVYNLTAHYNTDAKILETLAIAEEHGINTLVIHTVPRALNTLRKHRDRGGKMQWIICATAPVEPGLKKYEEAVRQLVEQGTDAIYLWGVHADKLVAQGKIDLMVEAVELAKSHGLPSGVGAHDLRVIQHCEERKAPADFYIKTFHHHRYPSGPKPKDLTAPYKEHPGYWCSNPAEVTKTMADVKKPWIAFKVMSAGAIPPADAFLYAFNNGADHVLAGMFDFEIAEDTRIAKTALTNAKRTRPWLS